MITLTGIEIGARIRIVGDMTAEVIEIVSDEWAKVRLLDGPASGTEELCHATDIVERV